MMRVSAILSLWMGAVGCAAAPTPTPTAKANHVLAPPEAPSDLSSRGVVSRVEESSSTRAARDARFLVHSDAGMIIVRSVSSAAPSVLIRHADFALYDSELELIWYIEANQLRVFDLRALDAPPAVIVRDMRQLDRITVVRGAHSVSEQDGCETPYAVLDWTTNPKMKLLLVEGDAKAKVDGRAWLHAQLNRPARSVTAQRRFVNDKVDVASELLDCEDEETCATSVPFAKRGWQLLLVTDKSGGDCWERACLLRDPRSNRYASPPRPERWGLASAAQRGPCGPYRFEQTQSAYLVGRLLCAGDGPCQDVGGAALGWLIPGDTIGE
jgi:hypothetical protein